MKNLLLVLFFVLFSIGCSSNHREFNDIEESALIDYISWLDKRHDMVMEEASSSGIEDDLSDLLTQSLDSDYFAFTGKPDAIAIAHISKKTIDIHRKNPFWDVVLDDYLENRDAWDYCEDDRHYYQAKQISMVFCHENAHIIKAKPHEEVYEIGYICEDLWEIDLVEWEDDCNIGP
jgi:hypothetical protein